MNSRISFNHWFVVPIESLKNVPNNDGSFVALASALFLYERYIIAKIKSSSEKVTDDRKIQQVASDFGVSTPTAKIFWDVMRNGLLHQGMPKIYEHGNKLLDWRFEHGKSAPAFEVKEINGKSLLIVQPWLVIERIIQLWQENLDLLEENESFPWAQVFNIAGDTSQADSFLITGSSSGLGILGIDNESDE
jgi:hypothetical protein